jgi:hypothetical protein
MSTDFKSGLYDPNGELTDDDLYWALIAGGGAFHRCRIKPQHMVGIPCKTLVYGEMGAKKYLVYVRVTHAEEEEVGTGPLPLVLLDTARAMDAEPFVVRVNMSPVGQGTAFRYWGSDELEHALKANTAEWHSLLLRGKTVQDIAHLVKGKISRLELNISVVKPGDTLPAMTPDEFILRHMLGAPVDGVATESSLSVTIMVNGEKVSGHAIDLVALARSCFRDDEFYIFSCDCGEPGCARINKGVIVVTEEKLTVWKAYSILPCHVFVFDHRQYTEEIIATLRQFVSLYKSVPAETADSTYFWSLPDMEKALFELETESRSPS